MCQLSLVRVNLRGSRENLKHKILSIVLKSASGIEARHCVINLKEGIATLVPQSEDAMCMINAVTVNQPIRLYQGCVIVLGKTNMFRYVSLTFFSLHSFIFFSHLNYEHTTHHRAIFCKGVEMVPLSLNFFTWLIKVFKVAWNNVYRS